MDLDSPVMQAAVQQRTLTFNMQFRNQEGVLLEGQFTTRKLSIREHTSVTVRKTQLNGGFHYDERKPGYGIDERTDYTNHMLATLEVCLIQKPTWFDVNKLEDFDFLLALYKKCVEFEDGGTSPQPGAAVGTGSSQTGGGGTSEQPRAAGSVAEVGRGQVPPSLDP